MSLTQQAIDSSDWPPIIKEKTRQIIAAKSQLNEAILVTQQTEMLAGDKVKHLNRIANAHQKLANSYRELAKELVYHLAHRR